VICDILESVRNCIWLVPPGRSTVPATGLTRGGVNHGKVIGARRATIR
jgi:hypothetical protein